ncbi:hypothetical protein JMN32_03710 [Fulvivirga sp. 29W222]|uniref:Uncharacterized protein n=1 Tax=Fulvivirga marina TaxID=2494733 RepID=A0A937KB10_9BACT|nr:hypothetical protein [Fulvivirga marina]MBL6445397.1 hypothetical protein [Fulvivirga marina]
MIRVYDFTHKLKGNYFVNTDGIIVMVDLEHHTIKVSGFRLKLYFILCRSQMKELPPDQPLYNHVIRHYRQLLHKIPII